jgi:tRNA (guanine37-N1)-methyltransferase
MRKPLKITILTLFPDFIQDYTKFGIIQRAIKKKLISIKALHLRQFGLDARGTVDDRPYGGGVGMVLRPDVVQKAIASWKRTKRSGTSRVILLTPQGKKFSQKEARRLVKYDHMLFVSGRYEGFDERVRSFVDEEFSIGDYVLMGGELPALVMTEAIIRLIPGVLGKFESTQAESFSGAMLEYPHYTKPEVLKVGKKTQRVPKVLLTGHHAKIKEWRVEEALKRTKKRRSDLL